MVSKALKQIPGPAGSLALCQGQPVFKEQLSGADNLEVLNLSTALKFFFSLFLFKTFTLFVFTLLVSQYQTMGLFVSAFV